MGEEAQNRAVGATLAQLASPWVFLGRSINVSHFVV